MKGPACQPRVSGLDIGGSGEMLDVSKQRSDISWLQLSMINMPKMHKAG